MLRLTTICTVCLTHGSILNQSLMDSSILMSLNMFEITDSAIVTELTDPALLVSVMDRFPN
jgi:hypothetical protein